MKGGNVVAENINTAENGTGLNPDEIIQALEICAAGDDEACLICPYGTRPGTDCCGKLLEDAAAILKEKKGA